MRIAVYTVFLTLFAFKFAIAQNKNNTIDSLINLVNSSNDDNELVDIYNLISSEYLSFSHDSSNLYNEKAYNLAKKNLYYRGMASAYQTWAKSYIKQDSFKLAGNYLLKAEELFISINDTFKLVQVNLLKGKLNYYTDNYDSAIVFYEYANYWATKINAQKQIAISYKQIGKTYWIKGDMIKSLSYYKKSLPVAIKVKDTSLTCVLYNNIGVIYLNVADYDKALKYYYLSLSLRDSLNDIKGKTLTLNNIGMIFALWDRGDEALKYYNKASEICSSIDYPFGTAYSYYNLGNYYLRKDGLDSAIIYFKKAMYYYDIINDLNGVAICYEKSGSISELKGDYKSAKHYYGKMLSISDSVNNINNKARALFDIANLYYIEKDYRQAYKYAEESKFISINKKYKKLSYKNYNLLADIYKSKNNYKKALEYYLIATQLNDSIFNDEKSLQISQLEILHKTAEKEQENIALKKEQEKQLVQSKADKLTIKFQYTLVGTAFVILLFAVLFTLIVYREKKKLEIANNTINKLFSIIGHDLRGPLGNFKGLIDLILMDEEGNDPVRINSLLKLMQKSASSNYDLLENLLSWSSSKSGKVNYEPAKLNLRDVVNLVIEHNDYSAVTKSIRLFTDISKEIYVYADEKMLQTIFRNLISNAIKFTEKGGEVKINCIKKEVKKKRKQLSKMIEIAVSDSGMGISDEGLSQIFNNNKFFTSMGTNNEKGTGLGLKLCKEFVNLNKGKIRVESEQGVGTNIIFTVPEYVLS